MAIEKLKLHAEGEKNHLSSIKKSYEFLKNKIQNDTTLSSSEKKNELYDLKQTLKKKNQDSKYNLY